MKTPGHDPDAFGQVRFSKQPGEGDGKGAQATGARADVVPTRDRSWDPPARDDDIEASVAAVAARAQAPAVVDAAADKGREPVAQQKPAPSPERAERPRIASPAARPIVVAPHAHGTAPGATLAEAAAPAVVFSACEAGAAWLWLAAGSPVLGALAALLGVGLAAFAWFAMRR